MAAGSSSDDSWENAADDFQSKLELLKHEEKEEDELLVELSKINEALRKRRLAMAKNDKEKV